MPKEITHWLVALKVAKEARGSITGDAALRYPNALQLGAVFPDILFYATGPPSVSRYRQMAHACHGDHGEDSYRLIREIAAALPGSTHFGPLRAFLAGVSCHIQTDLTFHPLVYHLTGDYGDADPKRRSCSVRNHRRLECLIDIYFCGGVDGILSYSLKEIVKNLEMPLSYLLGTFSRIYSDDNTDADTLSATERALRNFQWLQGLIKGRGLSAFLDKMSPWLPLTAQEFIALFYSPSLDIYLPRLNGAIGYRNPATGIAGKATLPELFGRAVDGSVAFITQIEAALCTGKPILPEKGPSLSYGVAGALIEPPRYFSEIPFFNGD